MEVSWHIMIWGSFCYLDFSHRSESYFRVSSKLNSSRTIKVLKVSNLSSRLSWLDTVDTASFTFPEPHEVCFIIILIITTLHVKKTEACTGCITFWGYPVDGGAVVEQDLNPAPSSLGRSVSHWPCLISKNKKSDGFEMLNFHLLISLLAGSHLCPCQFTPQVWVVLNKLRLTQQENLKKNQQVELSA